MTRDASGETCGFHALLARSSVAALVAIVVPLGLYLAGAWAAAAVDGVALLDVPVFEPDRIDNMSTVRAVAAGAMAVGAVGFLFVVPGSLATLAFMRTDRTRPTAHAWSLILNSVALILVFFLLRHTWGIHRLSLMTLWLLWTCGLFTVAWRGETTRATVVRLAKRHGGALLIGLAMIIAAITVLFPEQFVQCFAEDGTEAYELARSLRHHFLPQWELETWEPIPGGRMGTVVVNPSLINSYWTCGVQCLLGENEPATRLSYWVWWMAVFAVAYRLVGPSPKIRSSLAAVPLGLLMLLVGLLFTFYVGYNPYMADLANPGVPNALFTLLLLLSFDCLRHKDRAGWVAATVLASLVLHSGIVVLIGTLAAAWLWQPIERRETFRWGLWGLGAVSASAIFYVAYGWADGSLPYWVDTFDIEYLNDYLAEAPRWKSGPLFLGYFILASGGIAALGLVLAFRRSAWDRTVASVCLLYLLVVLGSGFKNLHYLGPLLPIPIVLFLRNPNDHPTKPLWRRSLAATVSVLLCIAVCWPNARATFTLNRALGQNTTMATDSYLTAVRWAGIRHALRRQGVMSWDCDRHTWAAYAELDPDLESPRPLILAAERPSDLSYRPIPLLPGEATDPGVTLYAFEGQSRLWFPAEGPPGPLDRYPTVFCPLADGLFSPHNNPLQDVRRLRRP